MREEAIEEIRSKASDHINHREQFKLVIKGEMGRTEKFPGVSIEDDQKRLEDIVNEIKRTGGELYFRGH